jgi:uncharacterized membrane protein
VNANAAREGDRVPLALFVFLASFYFLFSAGLPPKGDAYLPLTAAIEFVQGRGVMESRYMPGLSMLLVPIAFVANVVVSRLGEDASRWVALIWIANLFPALVIAAASAALYRLARTLDASRERALFCALAFGLATPAAVYAKNIFPQSAETLFLILTTWGVIAARRRSTVVEAAHTATVFRRPLADPLVLSGLAFGMLLLVKLVALVVLPVFALFVWFLARDGRGVARLARWAAPAVALSLLYLPYNAAAHGDPLAFGYADGRDALWGFATPLAVGVYGLLLSPGKGFFFYAPILVLAIPGAARLWRRDRAVALLFLGIAAGWLAIHAKWWAWHADHAWGPRYLVPVLPIAVLLAIEALRDFRPSFGAKTIALVALVIVSFGVQVLGASFAVDAYQVLTYETVLPRYDPALGTNGPRDDEIHAHMIPEFSPLVGHAWLLAHAIRGDSADAYERDYPWQALRPNGAWAPVVGTPPVLDFWLTRFPSVYPSRRVAAAIVAAAAAAGALGGIAFLARAFSPPKP